MSCSLSELRSLIEQVIRHQQATGSEGAAHPEEEPLWRGWHTRSIGGFHTHPVYRATREEEDMALKLIAQGPRDGAGREYGALFALQLAGLDIAPQPILLDRFSYGTSVVVTTWIDGEVHDEPPSTDAEWFLLARHLAAATTIAPESSKVPLRPSVESPRSAQETRERFYRELSAIPRNAHPEAVRELAQRIEGLSLPTWTEPRPALVRGDPNILNFVWRTNDVASVDWEDSGWGDPTFDIGDLMAHPAYQSVPQTRWEWLAVEYGHMLGDASASGRIRTYYMLTIAWWAASLANRLYQLATGQRTGQYIGRPPDWEQYLRGRYEQYIARARELLP